MTHTFTMELDRMDDMPVHAEFEYSKALGIIVLTLREHDNTIQLDLSDLRDLCNKSHAFETATQKLLRE